MKVAITGTPGTGKTTAAKILAKITGYVLLDLNGFAKARNLTLGIDDVRKSAIIDIPALKREISQLEGNMIIEGHLSHFCDADIFIALRANPKELSKRMRAKGWSEEKIRENTEAEIMNICLDEAVERHGKSVFEIDTTKKSPKDVASDIKDIIDGKNRGKYAPGRIDWTDYIR